MGSQFKGSPALVTIATLAVSLTSDPGCLLCTCRTCQSTQLSRWIAETLSETGTKCYFGKYVTVATLIFPYCFGFSVCGACICAAHICGCACVQGCVLQGLRKLAVNRRCPPQSPSIWIFQTGFLTEHRAHQLDRPAGQCVSWIPSPLSQH